MKTTKKQIIIFALLLLLFSAQFILIQSSPKTCDAADSKLWTLQEQSGLDEIGKDAYGGEEPKNDIKQIVVNIIKIFLGFLAIIFVALIIFAGFKYMTSMGNEEKIKEALSQIKTGLIGLIIILSAYAITTYITDCVIDVTTGGWTWMCDANKF